MQRTRRPKELEGKTVRQKTGCGNLYVLVNWNKEGRLVEVFAIGLGRAGGCPKCQNEALTRSITMGLKYGVPISEYIKQLEDIQCPNPVWQDEVQIKSCADAIAQVLRRYCNEGSNHSSD